LTHLLQQSDSMIVTM